MTSLSKGNIVYNKLRCFVTSSTVSVAIPIMVSITCIVWCLLLVYGISCELPTPFPDQFFDTLLNTEEVSNEPYFVGSNCPKLPKDGDEPEWRTYSPEVYPLFRRAIKEIAQSEHAIMIFRDAVNRLDFPREIFEQVFEAYNRLATEGASSSATEESQEATMYHLATTDPHGSEVVTDAYTAEDGTTGVDDSSSEYHASESQYHHTSAPHEGDEVAMYYTTESPMLEAMLTDGGIYASPVSSEYQEDASEESDGHVTSVDEVYESASREEVNGDEESSVDASESADVVSEGGRENIKRSGVLVEEDSSHEDEHCEGCPLQVGSIRGIPGDHFPNYDDIPITSFSCADKQVPGFYADLETGCQVFHVCWPHRRESFLCPIGTLFNQAILACDYWYSTDCSLTSIFFDVTTLSPKSTSPAYEKPVPTKFPKTPRFPTSESSTDWSTTESYIVEDPNEFPDERPHVDLDWFRMAKFLPVKSKVYSKHSSKKPGSKGSVEQKHDVLPLVEEFLAFTKNVAQNAIRHIPKMKVDVVKPSITKAEVVKGIPAAKLEPCLKIKDLKIKPHFPTPVVRKPQPLPKLNPRFIVKPVVAKKPPVLHVKKEKFVLPKVSMKLVEPLDIKASKHHTPEIFMKALEVAGNVLQRDILDLAQQALVGNYVSSMKTKH